MVWHLRLIAVILLFAAAGCVQFTPRFLMGSSYERAELLWQRGLILEAREAALMVGEKEPDYKEARALLVKIKTLSLEVAREHMELGEDYDKAGIAVKAVSEYRKSLMYNPSNAFVKRELRRLEEGVEVGVKAQQRRSKAKKKRKIEEADPEVSANIHYMRGKIYLESKAYPKAIVEFDAASDLIPGFLDTKLLLARAVKERDLQIDRHFKKGISYFQKEEMELAVEEWNSVLRLKPSHKVAQEYRGRARQIIERIKKIKERQYRESK